MYIWKVIDSGVYWMTSQERVLRDTGLDRLMSKDTHIYLVLDNHLNLINNVKLYRVCNIFGHVTS